MFNTFDSVRLLSLGMALATVAILLVFWKRYPLYQPQFLVILFYMFHGLIYYFVLLYDRITPAQLMTNQTYNDWGAVLRFHSYATWFFVAVLYFRLRGGKRE